MAVRKDGTSPFVMPPPGFYHISDSDLGALIAYLRSLPVVHDSLPANTYRILGTPREATTRLELMAETARGSLTHLTDDEISPIYRYLQARPLTGAN